MKSILFYFLAGTLLTEGCSMGMHVVKQDELVKIYSRESILPHGYGDQVLEFKGKRYKHFFGAGYVRVPGKDMLLFVTSKDGERKTLHAVPIGKGEEIEIDLGDTSFGSGLGYPKDDPASHYIESVEGDKITFVAKSWIDTKGIRFIVDLKARTFARGNKSESQRKPTGATLPKSH